MWRTLSSPLCQQEGMELASCKPQYGAVVGQRLDELQALWNGLHDAAKEKGQQLFEANRTELYSQSYSDLERWLGQVEGELHTTERAKDLTSANLLLKKLTVRGMGMGCSGVRNDVRHGTDGVPLPAAGGAGGGTTEGTDGAESTTCWGRTRARCAGGEAPAAIP